MPSLFEKGCGRQEVWHKTVRHMAFLLTNTLLKAFLTSPSVGNKIGDPGPDKFVGEPPRAAQTSISGLYPPFCAICTYVRPDVRKETCDRHENMMFEQMFGVNTGVGQNMGVNKRRGFFWRPS